MNESRANDSATGASSQGQSPTPLRTGFVPTTTASTASGPRRNRLVCMVGAGAWLQSIAGCAAIGFQPCVGGSPYIDNNGSGQVIPVWKHRCSSIRHHEVLWCCEVLSRIDVAVDLRCLRYHSCFLNNNVCEIERTIGFKFLRVDVTGGVTSVRDHNVGTFVPAIKTVLHNPK